MHPLTIAIHGGAGTIDRSAMTDEKYQAYTRALAAALDAGYQVLALAGSALDAVQAAVMSLEDCPLFNAGKGAVFNHEGGHELDAAIMEGAQRRAGAVCGVTLPRNPVQAARAVMEHTEHVLLSGAGADRFVRNQGLPIADANYFFDQYRYDQWQEALAEGRTQLDHSARKMGTVGAVALDQQGHLAAATSTGGMTNKQFGRVGDSPLIGAGTWADNSSCAVSCTGHGELFIRGVVAYDVACLMEYGGLSLEAAADRVVMDKLVRSGGEGGLVAVDALGNVALPFNSQGMYRGWRNNRGAYEVAVYRDKTVE